MPFRFRRSIKILPGVRWNVGTRGSSWSFGSRGFRTTVGGGKVHRTFSIPGSGLSYSTTRKAGACCPLAILLLPFFAVHHLWKIILPKQSDR